MATTKVIDLFGVLKGIDFHLAIEPNEGESGMEALVKAVDYLVSKGATGRPQGKGWGGGGKPKEPPATICPTCQSEVVQKEWTSPDQKKFVIHFCKRDDTHYKKFVPGI